MPSSYLSPSYHSINDVSNNFRRLLSLFSPSLSTFPTCFLLRSGVRSNLRKLALHFPSVRLFLRGPFRVLGIDGGFRSAVLRTHFRHASIISPPTMRLLRHLCPMIPHCGYTYCAPGTASKTKICKTSSFLHCYVILFYRSKAFLKTIITRRLKVTSYGFPCGFQGCVLTHVHGLTWHNK